MIPPHFDLTKANKYLPQIILIGLGIGTANFFIHGELNWFQWAILSTVTSLIIGYTLVSLSANRSWLERRVTLKAFLFLLVGVAFFLVGVIALEIETLISKLVLQTGPYQPLSAGDMYLFNGTISLVLGFSFFLNKLLFKEAVSTSVEETDGKEEAIIRQIPVKKGESIFLIPVEEIVCFEAYDNYSYVYSLTGERRLCDYSLLFLEQRLDNQFSRVHRKYIVNTSHIQQIKPHLNGRFLLLLEGKEIPEIISSKSYGPVIRQLIKLS
ncbi:MAG: LytTR family DNA-binding domain-containing protein [Bacteroidota bacterium]